MAASVTPSPIAMGGTAGMNAMKIGIPNNNNVSIAAIPHPASVTYPRSFTIALSPQLQRIFSLMFVACMAYLLVFW